MSNLKFGGTVVTVLCNPDISDSAVEELHDSMTASMQEVVGVYAQFSTTVIKRKIESNELALPDEDEELLLEIAKHYDYIEV